MPAKLIDITGKRYGHLIVTGRADDYVSPKGVHFTQWNCLCDCGNTVTVRKTHLTDGETTSCGCIAKKRTSERSMVDLKGKRFGLLVAYERIVFISAAGKKESKWKCRCDCGNETIARTSDLRSGQTKSCGCLRVTNVSAAHFDNIAGIEYGYLTPEVRVQDYVTRSGFVYSQWLCRCRCGNTKIVPSNRLKRGTTSSCGCKAMSTGEEIIDNILSEYQIDNEYNYTFDDLIGPGGGKLMFDFALFKDGELLCLIEYQGEQHFKQIEFGKQQREITDPMKRIYCKNKNIKLYEIKYDQNIKKEIDKIIDETIYANTVPSPEKSGKV